MLISRPKKYNDLNARQWLKSIIDPQVFSDKPLISPRLIYGKTKFILGMKCFKKDEYSSPEIEAFEVPVYSCKFGSSDMTNSLLCLGYEDGRMVLQQTDGPDEGIFLIEKKVFGNAIFDLAWMEEDKKILTAVADGTVGLLSVEDMTLMGLYRGHSRSVKTLDINVWDSNVFASGSRDCNVVVWDKRCHPSSKANEISSAHSSYRCSSNSPSFSRSCVPHQVHNGVISVLFSQQQTLLSAGASDGLIKMWDLRKTYSRTKREPLSLHVLEYPGTSSYKGYTSMQLSPCGERVYVSCLDGKIYSYHLVNPTPKPVAEYYGHRPYTYYAKLCLSPCGSYLLSGSSDDDAYIWLTSCPGVPVANLTGHKDEVTCMAWNIKTETLVTCSDDMKHRIFKYKHIEEKELQDPEYKQNLVGYVVPYKSPIIVTDETSKKTPNKFTNFGNQQHLLVYSIENAAEKYNAQPDLQSTPPAAVQQSTPSQLRSDVKQVTPKTSGKKTILSWLSSSKTPLNSTCLKTPPTSHPSTSSNPSTSSKIKLKRKLNDIIEKSEENLHNEDKKIITSPSKTVLVDRLNVPASGTPSQNVAKMLRYGEDTADEKQKHDVENDKTKLAEELNVQELTSPLSKLKTPAKKSPRKLSNLQGSPSIPSLSSPTANLPNFVIDGRSPHNRRSEAPLTRKRQADWLTSLCREKSKAQKAILPPEPKSKAKRVVKTNNLRNKQKRSTKKK